MAPMFNGKDPFPSVSPGGENCHGNSCPSGEPPSFTFCGSQNNPTNPDYDACSGCDTDNTFLNCYIAGFGGKLGLGASESSVSVDLVEKMAYPCPSSSPCFASGIICEEAGTEYNGQLGHVYSLEVGSFCFRGILSNHSYTEGENGYRYKVMLVDGRSCLSNVNVILGGFYSSVPSTMKPNLINAIYELENSVGNDNCGSGNRCSDFMKSGVSDKGILIKKALIAINNQICQVPVSNVCLVIDVSKIITIAPDYYRITSTESTVLEIIDSACKEAGYDFFIKIVGNTIEAIPVNKKIAPPDGHLFSFMQTLSIDNQVSNREYGEELSFEKSKKLVFGDSIHYLVEVDNSNPPPGCVLETEPSPSPSSPSSSSSPLSCILPGAYSYHRFRYSVNTGPGTAESMPNAIGVNPTPSCSSLVTPSPSTP